MKRTAREIFWIIMSLIGFICLAWMLTILTGCGLMNKTETHSATSAERLAARNSMVIERALEGDKRPSVSLHVVVSGSSNVVTIPYPNGAAGRTERLSLTSADRQSASSDEEITSTLKQALPWAVSALGIVGAGWGVLYLLKAARKASPAVAAAMNVAEGAIARRMDQVNQKLALASDATRQAELSQELLRLTREQAELDAQKSKVKT